VRAQTAATVIFSSALILTFATSGAAQSGSQLIDRPLLGVGLSFLRENKDTGNGVAVDFVRNFAATPVTRVGAVGDFALHHFNGLTDTSYSGGIRATTSGNDRLALFGQFMVGLLHCGGCGGTNVVFGPAAGVDVAVAPGVNFRGQVDFRFVRVDGGTFNQTRYWFGVSLAVGR
jgi:hypothetical protein